MRLVLEEPFKRLWSGRDPFEAVEALQGKVYRELEGRRTLRTEVDGRGYFVKIHRGIGWGEIAKNLLTAKLPVLGARQEWQAIRRLHEAGVATMTAVAYGEDKPVSADDFRLSVIDLHRAQTRDATPKRWRNKDLAALYFSALDIGLTRRDKLRFLRTYFRRPLREILRDEAGLLAWMERKAEKLYERKQRYGDLL